MSNIKKALLPLAISLLGSQSAFAVYEEVIVSAELIDTPLYELPGSVSVIDKKAMVERQAKHLEDVIARIPNVNFSTGASRGRFFQIRGIGERAQFIDPVNPSVGLIVDGIDFTGLGLAASTLDVEQIEVLRGPQGTLYGANALAGLVNITSNTPGRDTDGRLAVEIAEYGHWVIEGAATAPLTDIASLRVAGRFFQSDGFIENDFLNKDDTNNFDETLFKTQLALTPVDGLSFLTSVYYIDVDNGYDAFNLTNTRTTLSDNPGHDRQESWAISENITWDINTDTQLNVVVSAADTKTEYGYDEDWVFDGFHPDGYNSTDNYERDRDNISLDARVKHTLNTSVTFVAGIYYRDESESLNRRDDFESDYDTQNTAVYGQVDWQITDRLALLTGLRYEQRDADYSDNVIGSADNFDESEWGGRIALEYQITDQLFGYGLISRGYKSGGVNGQIISASISNSSISPETFTFDTETLVNYEAGIKGSTLEDNLAFSLSLFQQNRNDVQASVSLFNPSDFSFDEYLDNASKGKTVGLELESSYSVAENLQLDFMAAYLNAEFDDFENSAHVDSRDDFTGDTFAPVDMNGRDTAYAPNYQFLLGADIGVTDEISVRVEVEGKDEFFLSDSHDVRSEQYELINANITYQLDGFSIMFWGKNLTDKDVITRGFYFSNQFGNNPAIGYAPEPYFQFGAPRQVGLTASYTF